MPLDDRQPSAAVVMLAVIAGGFALSALLYNEWCLRSLSGKQALRPVTVEEIHRSQLVFAGLALSLGSAAWLARRTPRLERWLDRPSVSNWLVAVLAFATPLLVAEHALRPIARSRIVEKTTLFERDPELEWRYAPGAHASWGNVDVEINRKGLRGPEVTYAKRRGAVRILWLGDSVTVGYRLPRHDDAVPWRSAARLESAGVRIETVNAAVDGYSPWQENAWLRREGFRYHPDLVVVGFVLNDVSEKLGLSRFGGHGQGYQLSHSASWLDRLAPYSGLLYFGRELATRLRFGADPRHGAVQEEVLRVESLAREPGRDDVQRAWKLTLDELAQLVGGCRERGVPVVLVVYPYTFQLDTPDQLDAPQSILRSFAADRGVPILDLLPPMAARLHGDGAVVTDWFFDENHLTARGSDVVGEMVATFLASQGLVHERMARR
jgi:lysophospholipase L1-like esterase